MSLRAFAPFLTMGKYCCVPSCRQKQLVDPGYKSRSKVSFFRLPYGNQDLLQKWLDAITKDEDRDLKFHRATKVCSRHFDEDDYYRGYVNGKRYLKDGTVPHIFAGRVPEKGATGHCRPVPDAALLIATVPRTSAVHLVRPQHGQTSPFTAVVLDTGACRGDKLVPNINSAVVEVKCKDEVEKCEGDVEERVTVDPVHTYCKPATGNRVEKEVGVGPDHASCDEPSQMSNQDTSSPQALSRCSVQIVASGGYESDSDTDASMGAVSDTDMPINSEDGKAILPDDTALEILSEAATEVPPEFVYCSSQAMPSVTHLGHSGNAHPSNGEQSLELDGLQKRVLQLEKEIEQMNRAVEWYKQEAKDAKKDKYKLARTVELLEQKCQKLEKWQFTIESFRHSCKDVNFYTGLPDYATFEDLYQRLAGDRVGSHTRSRVSRFLSDRNRLFLLLVRYRLGLPEPDLAFRFHVSCNTVSNICLTWTRFIYRHLHQLCSGHCTHVRGAPLGSSATEFVSNCDHRPIDSRPELQELSDTCKVVTSISSRSATIFVCPPMDMASARHFAKAYDCQEGLPSYDDSCKVGDGDVAVQDILREMGLPPNLSRLLGQHGSASVLTVDDIVSLYEDIEHVIPKIKGYRIFQQPFPLSLLPVAKEMLAICVALTNFPDTSSNRPDE